MTGRARELWVSENMDEYEEELKEANRKGMASRTGKEKHRISVMSSLSDISRRGKKEGPGKQTFRKGSVVHV